MATPPENVETTTLEDEGRRANVVRIAAIAGGAIVLLILVWFFLLRGGDEPAPVEVTAPPVTTPSPTIPEGDKEDRKNGPVETFDVFAARDPFQPLDGGGGGGAAPATGTDTGTDGGAGDGEVLIDDGGASGGGESIGGHRVRLVDVFPSGNRAQVQVDGTVYTVDEGEQFADNFELVSTSGQCATMLFGDDEFTLCEGEEVLK